ncbi:putative serine/threonine-protein kinase SIS8 [Sesamum angolense]|uniref:Serine/threonine-protein kinase SIS8 n=1 Tax=Sesamum angolense TaxID=2727404 RepID=A0AAE2BUL7_9LAMI|nr:putative serine/threonine-protein kinase SIS8 [Sesamum angolense]
MSDWISDFEVVVGVAEDLKTRYVKFCFVILSMYDARLGWIRLHCVLEDFTMKSYDHDQLKFTRGRNKGYRHGIAFSEFMDMEDMQDDAGPSEERSPRAAWWPSDFVEKFGSVSLDSKDSKPRNKELNDKEKYDRPSSITASQILWRTGMLSEPIPNGFYSVVPGLPMEGASECVDSYKHLSVLVVLNSVELLVDLMRFPGQLIPRSSKAIFMTHISAAGESDSAENDSCDSPLEPNSPLYGVSERVDPESAEKEESLLYQRRLEASSNAVGPSLRNMMLRSNSIDTKLSLSQSEPNIAAAFWQRSRRKVIAQNRTASSRAVRAMNESLKQNRLLREQGESGSYSFGSNVQHQQNAGQSKDGSDIHVDDHDNISGGRSSLYAPLRQHGSQKAVSLPSSPHEFMSHTPPRSGNHGVNEELVSTWNRVLDLPMFHNKPLLPFEEWNIDFSELTVGTRVGIGFFGEVFRGIWNGTEVAIKVFLEQDLTAENMEDFCNEISILSLTCAFSAVILFLGACTRPPRLSMITEYMEMGSLYYLIHLSGQKKKLSWRRRIKMLRDICRGLMCIHRMKIIHRDLKSANCLVNKHWTVKICDFGLSRIMTDAPIKDSSSAGTPEWMAPELIRNEPFTEKCDIFSLGVVMWELYTLNRPWDGVPPERVVYAVANEGSRLEIPEGPVGRLIADCWAEPQDRPSCEEILTRLLDCELALC